MKDYAAATQLLRRLAQQFQGMVDAADILEQIGPPAQALDELNRELEAARAELAQTRAEHAQVAKSMAQAQANAEDIVRAANEEAGRVAKQASDTALAVESAAVKHIEEMERAANINAASAVERAMADAQGKLDTLTAQIDGAHAEANAAIAARADAQRQLDNINQLLSAAKARVAALNNI